MSHMIVIWLVMQVSIHKSPVKCLEISLLGFSSFKFIMCHIIMRRVRVSDFHHSMRCLSAKRLK